ncbi:MAG: sulfatase-like hydrolase/transferase [Planctomycetes bacterium]|nr:sulfatase-like hydrolase/transferase [Planctomycetota bacterium]
MSEKPNIIFIYADDLGRGMLSCYGQQHFQTPNIDRIANEGMSFNNAYGCSFCAPSRASLITGTHDCHRGGWTFTNGGVYRRIQDGSMKLDELSELIHTISHIPDAGQKFLADIPKSAGYVTGEIGKLEWGFATTDREMKRHGWDYHYGYYDHQDCHGFYPPYIFDNGKKIDIKGNNRLDCGKATGSNETDFDKEDRWDRKDRAVYSQDLFDEKIIEFINKHHEDPFFLYHPSQLPHGPIIIPEIHDAVKNNAALSEYEKEYASMVLRLDQTVGIILDELDRLGIAENTMVMFCSDNGHSPYYQEEGRCTVKNPLVGGEDFDNIETKFSSEACGDIFNGNDGMAGLKFSNWEGGVRLPFLARWPKNISANQKSYRLISNYDFMATIAEILSVALPDNSDGISYLNTLKGDKDAKRGEPVYFAAHTGPAMVTDDSWKLRQITIPNKNLYQLFHLNEDYTESHNVVFDGENRELVNSMSTSLLHACDGNFINGTPAAHRVWYPGMNYFGPECDWQLQF